jgi:hypothetical protein
MLTEDYIMRLINQALAVFMTALGLKRRGKYQESLHSFDQALEGLLGVNARLADQLEDSMLLDRLTFMGKLDVERVLVLTDIYREEAEVYALLTQPEKSSYLEQRSMRLYLEVFLAGAENQNQELIQKIEALRHKITIASTPVETRLALQDYLDRLVALSDEDLATMGLARQDLSEDLSALDSLGSQ